MTQKTGGRKSGSRNHGFWFRSGRGWYTTEGRSAVRLCDLQGNHIKLKRDRKEAEAAYKRYLLDQQRAAEARAAGQVAGATVGDVCAVYLEHAKKHGSEKTYDDRADLLWDLCTGLPPRFRDKPRANGQHPPKPTKADYVHEGIGLKPVGHVIGLDIEKWLDAHAWKGGRRSAVQAIKRAFNYAVEVGLTEKNPIRGFRVDRPGQRATYFTDSHEQAFDKYAKYHLRQALHVCIRTGARPVSEFASLEVRHVQETDRGQCWRFPQDEHKTGKQTRRDRVIYVPEEIANIVRKRIRYVRRGPVFCNSKGRPWTAIALRHAFRRLRKRLTDNGIQLDGDACMYSCRHTYAKRMLGGFWGKAVTLEVLAGLMGNSRQVAWEHYGKWCESYTEPMWEAIS